MQADTQFLLNSLTKIREWRLQSPFRKRLRGRVCFVFADFCESAEVLVATSRARHTNAQTQRKYGKYGSAGFVNGSRPALIYFREINA
jgi:hypothetical protein